MLTLVDKMKHAWFYLIPTEFEPCICWSLSAFSHLRLPILPLKFSFSLFLVEKKKKMNHNE